MEIRPGTASDIGAITSDVSSVIGRWQGNHELTTLARESNATWLTTPSVQRYSERCAHEAVCLLATQSVSAPDHDAARFCIVTKQPHVQRFTTTASLLARLLAFGISVRSIQRPATPTEIAQVLYPTAYKYFADLPDDPGLWQALEQVFDTGAFADILGVRYSRNLVLSGRQAIEKFHITSDDLTRCWEEGRTPIRRHSLVHRYGEQAASMMLGGQDSYAWFRGTWPIGIHRLKPGVVAFTMRHELLGDRQPVIIVNGHYPGLAELFGPDTAVIDAGVSANSLTIASIRKWLVGHDNRPAVCEPGTIRRDALDGLFTTDSTIAPDSRKNVLHCSDGLLSGMIEHAALLAGHDATGGLAHRLIAAGLTKDEVHDIVAADPSVLVDGDQARLTELTQGQDLDTCTRTILRLVPPVFGKENGYASGVSFSCYTKEIAKIGTHANSPDRRLTRTLSAHALGKHITPADEQLGLDIIAAGKTAFVAPAGGTGGRFGGYDVPESDLRRQKALIPCFRAAAAEHSSLDIRLANVAYWRDVTHGRIPVAIMGSHTNWELLLDWSSRHSSKGFADLVIYQQFGTYRVRADIEQVPPEQRTTSWIHHIARNEDGTPSLKPPGNLGTLTCLILTGVAERWLADGLEFLAIANGDDVAFRLDPRILGMLARRSDVDAVVTAVPWGLQGSLLTATGEHQFRADASGWCMLDSSERAQLRRGASDEIEVVLGHQAYPAAAVSFDVAGALSEVATTAGWRVKVDESVAPTSMAEQALMNANQMYLRINALRRLMGMGSEASTPTAVASFVGSTPFNVERKVIRTGDHGVAVLQISQAMSSIFDRISTLPVRISRMPTLGQRGGYAALKSSADIVFAQSFLDEIAADDELLFD